MKRLVLFGVMALLASWLVTGCSDNGEDQEQGASESPMVVKVNSEVIIEEEVAKEETRMLQQMARGRDPSVMERMRPQARKQAVANLVNRKLLEQAAESGGYSKEPEKTEQRIKEIRDRFDSEADYHNQLASSGITEEKLRQQILDGTRIEKMIDEWTANMPAIPDSQALNYYNNYHQQFERQERVKASHILMKVDSNTTQQEKMEKKEKLAGIKREIKQGSDFAEMAREYSEGPSGEEGGNLGFFERGQMVPPFEKAAFSMEKGEISDLVESRFGYHLIKVTGREEAGTTPFEEVKDRIKEYLSESQEQQIVMEHLDSLRAESEIEYADSSLAQ